MRLKKTRRTKLSKNTKRKKRNTKIKGGSKIGEGRTSHVFQPPLKCIDAINSKYNSDKYVSKLTDSETAQKELQMAEKLQKVDPDSEYTIYPLASCQLDLHQINANFNSIKHTKVLGRKLDTLLISIYGGITINDIISYIEDNYKHNTDALPPIEYINNVWKSLCNLSDFIPSLYENNIIHNDLHYENLVYNQDDYKTRIIDFEFNNLKYISLTTSHIQDIYLFMTILTGMYNVFLLYYKASDTHNCNFTKSTITLDNYKKCCAELKLIHFSNP